MLGLFETIWCYYFVLAKDVFSSFYFVLNARTQSWYHLHSGTWNDEMKAS